MNKKVLILIIVVAIVLVGGYFIFYKGGQNPMYGTATPGANTPAANTPATTNPQPAQPESLNASVSIKNFAFNPTPLTVKVGTTVTWTNNDSMPHQIKSDTFNSAPLNNGQIFSFTFSAAGQYSYSCAIHPSMHGQITVTQ